ncbi:CvpA family protein [Sphingomicrobium clamense]|uniref:CvpA family protein n=1 Tax=Sphingomicrobium clamense TaxID=2851013 RepID=A0ABS6V7G1_9SPHN|nr:CvpA family protein [Sphingomicrobium sp. B8]MBW0145514.1 CvpA family protein [Sphingomicrobium sp. B8]
MTALDIFVIILLGGGALLGFVRGFVHEVLALFAWVAAILAVKFGLPTVVAYFGDRSQSDTWALIAGFAILFLPTYILVRILAKKLGGKTRKSIIGPIDRFLGGGFGILKGLVAATVVFLVANLFVDLLQGPEGDRPAWMTESETYALLNASTEATVEIVRDLREEDAL